MSFKINNRRYTGSKNKIVKWIDKIIDKECHNCNSFCDLFAGTGVVFNSVIDKFKNLYINDFLYSNEIIYIAFFSKEKFNLNKIVTLKEKFESINFNKLPDNYFSKNYGNKYFEKNDAKAIGYIREEIEKNKNKLNKKEYSILLASLIYSADRCANTVGHYEAYLKNSKLRSHFKYELIDLNTKVKTSQKLFIYRKDANSLANTLKSDIVYIDPPYSSRQYSRFYHVLENLVLWNKQKLYGVAVKPVPQNMSTYCSSKAIDSFTELVAKLNCKYIIVSYNNTYNSKSNSSRNKMELNDMLSVLKMKGNTKVFSVKHNVFNAGKTDMKGHKEILFVTKVK